MCVDVCAVLCCVVPCVSIIIGIVIGLVLHTISTISFFFNFSFEQVRLTRRSDGAVLFDAVGKHAGLEIEAMEEGGFALLQ